MISASGISQQLGMQIVRDRDAHDLSRNPEFSRFQFLGYRTSATAVELVALCDADGLAEGDVVRLRDEFFDLVRSLPHQYGLKPRGRNPNGLLGFVFAEGCPEPMARFIARQTRIDHAANTGGVSVAWAIDVKNERIQTHDNPVSVFPPVVVLARTVYPGLEYLQGLVSRIRSVVEQQPAWNARATPGPGTSAGPVSTSAAQGNTDSAEYDAFISYASEDRAVAGQIADALLRLGARVWMDELVIRIGDSLSREINRGLANSRFGVALISRNFLRKPWTQHELSGLQAREMGEGRTVILPVWHEIEADEVRRFSPPLADKRALSTAAGIPAIADQIAKVFLLSSALHSSEVPPPVAAADSPQARLLFLVANSVTRPMDLEREWERIETSLRLAKVRDRVTGTAVMAASMDRLMQALLDESPTIVHFSGHGRTGGIVMRTESRETQVVPGEALARLFALFKDTLQCVVLNACWSEPQARAIRQHVPYVVGILDKIQDEDAVAFSAGFYKAIAAGRDVPFAFQMGVASVHARGNGGEKLLVLL